MIYINIGRHIVILHTPDDKFQSDKIIYGLHFAIVDKDEGRLQLQFLWLNASRSGEYNISLPRLWGSGNRPMQSMPRSGRTI